MPVISELSATAVLFQEGLTFHVASGEGGGGLFSSLGPQVRHQKVRLASLLLKSAYQNQDIVIMVSKACLVW